MSSNYYIKTKDSEMMFDVSKRVDIDTENRNFIIHICQSYIGFKPIFEVHRYSSFSELKEVLNNEHYTFDIVDDFGDKIEVIDFIRIMENQNKKGKYRKSFADELIVDSDGFIFLDEWFR